MGFTTGFLGGVTLTSAVLYLTISMHTQNRMQQASLLRQQRQVLADFYEPRKPEPEPAPRVVPVGLAEMAKDRWNRSLEEGIQKIYNTDWRKVLDLLEERYLNLQDVIGNVEPLPTLVTYERYKETVLVYRMNTNHELFMGLIQDFTSRMSRELGTELWTWCVQWDVAEKSSHLSSAAAPSPKKPRLQAEEGAVASGEDQAPKKPVYDIFNRCELNPKLTKEEDMLRILIDIVQVNSTIVPNFVEFLYRWIDFYEGDGKALKAALKWEIPSLWEFDYHPLVLPADVKKKAAEVKATLASLDGTAGYGQSGSRSAQELLQGSPTKKMSDKPDVSAFEREVEESERLQYREVKFGIQPPKFQQPLSPLINIPREPVMRMKYYAACWKSRQRAVVLLIEAGLTMEQIGNYRRMQDEDVKGTSKAGNAKEMEALRHYYKDAAAAQEWFAMKEKQQQAHEKQKEIAISIKLDIEAQIAAADGLADGSSGVPLIPPTPSYPRSPDMAAQMLKRLQATRAKAEERVNFVPAPLVGKLRSKLFEGAKDRRLMQRPGRPNAMPPNVPAPPMPDSEDSEESDSNSEGSSDDQVDVNGQGAPLPSVNPSSHALNRPASGQPAQGHSLAPRPNNPSNSGPSALGVASIQPHVDPQRIAEYLRTLSPEQLVHLIPLMSQGVRQAVATYTIQMMGQQPPATSRVPTGTSPSVVPPPAGNSPSMESNGTRQEARPFSNANMNVSPGQSQSALMPPLPSPAQTQNVALPLRQYLPPLSHVQRGVQQVPDGVTRPPRPPGPPQISRIPSATSSPIPQLPRSPIAPSHGHNFWPSRSSPQTELHAGYATASQVQQQSSGSSLQTPRAPLQQPAPHQSQDEQNLHDLPRQSMPAAFQHLLLQRNHQSAPQQQLAPSALPTLPSITVSAPQPPAIPLPSPPRSMNRQAPAPLTLAPPSPLSTLAPSLLATSPFTASHSLMPIQVYFPRVVVPGNGIGPLGQKLGDFDNIETDAFLLGYSVPGSGRIVLSKAFFMPVGCWENELRRVRKGKYQVLEAYPAPANNISLRTTGTPHTAAYAKLAEAYSFMQREKEDREEQLTKRWRASPGPMTLRERGAVWEGWAVTLNRGMDLSKEERRGALVHSWWVDEGTDRKKDDEADRRRRELDELEAEEGWDDEEDEMDGGE
ncbi:hypothetical protein FB567DRAFT_543168 [Paraphoma chrysanthemicola]|uniref:MICOS complex subunit MIC12 n=1 Tax=Paraphoma chrysanthemicola TaxID=798071 RepID=A0A8K0RK03_9PLEO|nr:hypothetical protein FB567DRAFT_543168 [Paraphoma chrysanthemicola]